MMKRFLNSAASGAIFALAAMATMAFAVTLTGRNSDRYRSIDQVGMNAVFPELGITATPSGTQVNSYQLTAGVSLVSTVATTGDGVKLPSTTAFGAPTNLDASLNVVVANNGAAVSMNLFPFAATDIIISNGVAGGAGAALVVAKLKSADCWSFSTGIWFCTVG
jgi:hypothetical protein